LLGLASCVKQKNCDCEDNRTGYLVYLKEPYKMSGTACNWKEEKIVAHFFREGVSIPVEGKEGACSIKGNIPRAFRSGNPIKVNLCLKWDCEGKIVPAVAGPEIYSLKCIEKVD
jgi:hypothetical protein